MPDRTRIAIGLGAAIVAAVCCAAPMVAVTLGTAGLLAWLAAGAYLLIPALLVCFAIMGLWFWRHRAAAACSNPSANEQAGQS